MQLKLPPELQQYVAEKVKAGQFADPGDVIVGALDAMRSAETFSTEDVNELRQEIRIGIDQLDAGGSADFSAADIKAEGRSILKARRKP